MSGGPPSLFRHYPALAERVPWLPLGRFPTPVEPLRLDAPAAHESELWIKRDDRSGEPYGGNKVRKLEFLLAEARRRQATRLITAGAVGSHHALATAIYGRALGFSVTLVLFPQPLTSHVRQVLFLDHAFGAELRYASRMELVPWALLTARLAHRGERTFLIAPGGSDRVGTLGYLSAGLELADQIATGAVARPDAVHVTAGTLGTAAGLALGFALAGLETRIVASRITSRLVTNQGALRKLVAGTARVLQRGGVPVPEPGEALRRVELRHDQVGQGYGRETAAGRRAAGLFATEGITLDTTYTAKAAAGMLAMLAAEPPGVHLFWHTLSSSEPADAAAHVRVEDLPAPFRRYLADGGRGGPTPG